MNNGFDVNSINDLYVCMYIYIYVYIYIGMYVCVSLCVCVCLSHVQAYTHGDSYVCGGLTMASEPGIGSDVEAVALLPVKSL